MFTTLTKSIRSTGFPSWKTLGCNSPAKFILKRSGAYCSYENPTSGVSNLLFEQSASIIEELKCLVPQNDDAYASFITSEMGHAIFGSNMQERAGLGLEDTIRICLKIFRGGRVLANEIDEKSEEYQRALESLVAQGYPDPDMAQVIKGRREIIQHAQAYKFIVYAFLHGNEELSEQLICDTHKILCEGIPSTKGNDDYAGKYRTVDVMAGGTIFTSPQYVGREMTKLVKDFNDDVKDREMTGEMDPFFLAADICQDFVTIHPFLDGNGRMCRLIANAYLIKYAGIVISIGEYDEDRKEYLKIAAYAGDGETEEAARGTLASFFLERGERTLRKLRDTLKSGQ